MKHKITGFKSYGIVLFFFVIFIVSNSAISYAQRYRLKTIYADSLSVSLRPLLRETFADKNACSNYVASVPQMLREKGFLGASVDSLEIGDSVTVMRLFLGQSYQWGALRIKPSDDALLDAIGWRKKYFLNRSFDYGKSSQLREKLVSYLEDNGYPFAEVRLDSFEVDAALLNPQLEIKRGPLYKVDSIRIFGEANIRNSFLQRYLDIPNGSVYRKKKLLEVDKKLRQLPYLIVQQKSDISYLGSGALLNVYLKNKKSSQVNGLIGFLPSSDAAGSNKLLITGDFNLSLKNSFGLGESILVMFQQIQVQSPRLKLSYQQPYLFGSSFGTDFLFEGFKKDSSFLNIQYQLGVAYAFGGNRNGKVFFQQFITSLDLIDTAAVKRNNRLPDQIDQTTSGIGVDYEWWNTDYRFNPRSGYDIKVQSTAGLRRIRRNNTITSLRNEQSVTKDYRYLYDSVATTAYSFRLRATAARYFKTGRQTTLKTALNGGWVQSPSLFRNELFQLGGFQLLRGFDDESFFASAYTVLTTEYRVLTGQNSFLYAFWDGGWVRNQSRFANKTNVLWGGGMGATIDTRAGIFNVAFAVGKREELPINLRQLKIHFGYLNFF